MLSYNTFQYYNKVSLKKFPYVDYVGMEPAMGKPQFGTRASRIEGTTLITSESTHNL